MAQSQQAAWGTELAREQQTAARALPPATGKAGGEAVTETNLMETWTLQLIVRPLMMDIVTTGGIASFGLSWIALFLYTIIKDFTKLKIMADPGDTVFLFVPPQALAKIPESVKSWPRLFVRLLIYPVGGLLTLVLIGLFAVIFAIIAALLDLIPFV